MCLNFNIFIIKKASEKIIYGRIYDPVTARFFSPDPLLQDPTNTQNLNRYTYVLNNPLKYTNPSGYAYQGFGNSQLNGVSTTLLNSSSQISQQVEDLETRRKGFLSNLWGDVTLFDMIGRSGASANRQSYSSSSTFGFTPFYVTTPDAFVQNYYKHRVWLKEAKYLYERYGNMLPTIYQGGLTNSFEGFKNFMLDQAKFNPVEVNAFSFKYAGSDKTTFFVSPWIINKYNKSYPSMDQIPGFNKGEISEVFALFHTHPKGASILEGLSEDDIKIHYKFRVPIIAIEYTGDIYTIDNIIKSKNRFGQDIMLIPNRNYIGERSKW